MAMASPSRVAMFMEKMDMLVSLPATNMAPRVTVTARPPVTTGRRAEARLPNTNINATSATGRP